MITALVVPVLLVAPVASDGDRPDDSTPPKP